MDGALWVELSGDIIIARASRAHRGTAARMFCNDIAAALKWLSETSMTSRLTSVR